MTDGQSQPQGDREFSVVIPVFNEAANLEPLHTRLSKVMQDLGKPYEIIFVDDGSKDTSFPVLKGLQQKDLNVKVIRFTRNFGQHPAIMAGFRACQGNVVITLDADLQNPPEEIPKLLKKVDEGYEVVFGVFQRRQHSAFRKAGSAFTRMVLARIVSAEVTNVSAFRALKSNVIAELRECSERNKYLDGLLCWMGFTIGTVGVEHHQRASGKTKYNIFKLIGMWFDMMVSLSDLPLKVASFTGLFLGLTGLLLALFYIIRYLAFGFSVPGFATTVILITLFSGIQLFCLGILGEYIGRMNQELKRKPDYIVREKLGWRV